MSLDEGSTHGQIIDLGRAGDDPRVRRAAQHKALNCNGLGPCRLQRQETWKERRGSVTETDADDYEVDDPWGV